MISLILSTATKYLLPLLLIFAIFMLVRGHYEPGGGFVGGLVAASAFALYTISQGVAKARSMFPAKPKVLMLSGLSLGILSGFIGFINEGNFLKGVWFNIYIPVLGELNTPLLFDIGVFFVVIGVTLNIIFTLAES
jgi:multicomponent Na+:H+ antiporter subunit B